MPDQNPLLKDSFFSETAALPPVDNGPSLAQQVGESQINLPPPPTGKEVAKDVGQSIVAGGAKGLAGTLIGGPGSVETFLARDVPEAVRAGAGYLGERADLISPEQRRQMTQGPIYSGMTPEQEKGYLSPITGMPTYKAVTEKFKPTMKAAGADILGYEPQTSAGKVASEAAEFGAQGIPGALRTLPGRVATGAAAGIGSEVAALSSQDPDAEGYNRLLGALGGAGAGAAASSAVGKLFNGIKALAFSTKTAQNNLVDMIAEDIRQGKSPMTMEQIAEAQARGVDVTPMDLAGPETRKKIGAAAQLTPDAEETAARYNDFLRNRSAESGQRVTGVLQDAVGSPVDAAALKDVMSRSGAGTRDLIYTTMKNEPSAQAIPMAVIGADLVRRPIIQQAMRDAAKTAENNPSWGIVVPGRIPGAPATESRFMQTPQGIKEVPGTPAVPDQVTHGNLAYWDQVKREIDSKLTSAKSPVNPNPSDVATLTANKNDLVKKLDSAVPSYKTTRDAASETFQAASAPEAGYKFFGNMDAFKRSDARKAFNQYTPEQKDLFAIGFAGKIDEVANQPGGLASLAKKFGSDRNFRENARTVLGDEKYAQIQGAILSENLLSKAKELRFIEQPSGIAQASASGAMAGAALDTAMSGALMMSPGMAANVITGALLGAGGKIILNASERRIADKLLPMATDPSRAEELGRLASQSTAVGDLFDKIIKAMNNKIVTGSSSATTAQQRPQRATGGRAGGMTSDMLINAAERAKKSIGRDTEALLSTPDASVAKALAVANQKLEG